MGKCEVNDYLDFATSGHNLKNFGSPSEVHCKIHSMVQNWCKIGAKFYAERTVDVKCNIMLNQIAMFQRLFHEPNT